MQKSDHEPGDCPPSQAAALNLDRLNGWRKEDGVSSQKIESMQKIDHEHFGDCLLSEVRALNVEP